MKTKGYLKIKVRKKNDNYSEEQNIQVHNGTEPDAWTNKNHL